MNEMIPSKETSLSRYEELLLQRDALRRQAQGYLVSYIREFGELTTDVFQQKIEAIRLKKAIAICQMALNRGEHVDPEKMEQTLRRTMQVYQDQLKAMLQDNESAKNARRVPEYDAYRIKKLYRRLAMLIHPDLHPETAGDEKLSELWNRLSAAYHCSDLKEMEELEVLIVSACDGAENIHIPDVEEKIKAVEEEMENIKSTDPYLYGSLLEDPEAVREKKESLRKELEDYRAYASSLQNRLNRMMIMAGVNVKWPEN